MKKEETNRGKNYYLLLVGDGEVFEKVKVAASDLDKSVVFTGARADVNRLYSAMDMFCLPSFYEGMLVVAWEAQANGLSCIFSDNVSQEAKILEGSRFVSLDADLTEWTESIEHAIKARKKERVEDIPDIHEWADWLKKWYLKTCRENN